MQLSRNMKIGLGVLAFFLLIGMLSPAPEPSTSNATSSPDLASEQVLAGLQAGFNYANIDVLVIHAPDSDGYIVNLLDDNPDLSTVTQSIAIIYREAYENTDIQDASALGWSSDGTTSAAEGLYMMYLTRDDMAEFKHVTETATTSEWATYTTDLIVSHVSKVPQ